MSRHLTPPKIGLLVLIELYTDGIVSTSSTISLLSFILAQLLPSSSVKQPGKVFATPQYPILDLGTFEALLKQHNAASGHPGRSLWDHFLAKLWKIDSLDALHEFFARLDNLLAKSREDIKKDGEMGIPPPSGDMILLSRISPIGSFLRKAQIEFERLKFGDVLQLWTSFMKWRQQSKGYWARRGRAVGNWPGDKVLAEGEEEWGFDETETLAHITYGGLDEEDASGSISTGDVEKLLEFHVEQMQKLGTRMPIEVKSKLKSLLDDSIITPSLSHYLTFLDAWRSGDYPSSFDSLHRYFDYTMQNRDRLFYQYALMNLAVLQADFECYDEAVAAMLETVSTARENKDMACLNFALNWLYHFGKSHPNIIESSGSTSMLGVEKEGLAFLRIKAKETGMWTLWSSSLLSEAKLTLSNGESVATAFEGILKSSHLVTEKGMKSMMGPQTAMQSSLWGRLGVVCLSKQYSEIFLRCHARYGLFDDTLRITCRIAHYLMERGSYEQAAEKLEGLDSNSLRSWKANQYWLRYRGILRLKNDLHTNNLEGADHILSQLLQCDGLEADSDLSFEISTLHVDYLIRRADFGAALSKMEQLASSLKEQGDDINLRIKILTMKALLQSRTGRPEKGFSVAVRAASIAWRARLMPALWAAMAAVANILVALFEFQAACQIVTAIIPRALECENCTLSAQLYSCLADSFMGLAGQAAAGDPKRSENLTKALDFLDRAFKESCAIRDINGQCEARAKKAMVMMAVGDKTLANDYASSFLGLEQQRDTVRL
ncbi:f5e64528-fb3f-49b6-9565-50bb820acb3d [Sclerotinia trifoliorum]|uniref:Anaphase-promoting complex subunit 5 n=1 Tax=Sclerotinia trifoliorum TaxID=28548 RepID=A0A8H2W0K7_9HELO|nr:f5e64528-fb3f-49b6-9565-50bb820acb3d [Sclerotinia trifoliorum]